MKASLLAILAWVSVLAPRPSEACSCVARTAAEHFQQADLVFLGRAGRVATRGKLAIQPFAVLQGLKGAPGVVFEHRRSAGVVAPCDRPYQPGEVAVLFVRRGSIDLCSGNVGLDGQRDQLELLLRLGAARVEPPDLAAVTAALGTLQGYLHDRPSIPVRYAPLAGRTLELGKSKLSFVAVARAGAIEIARALRNGRASFLAGRYPTEGYSFEALVWRRDDGKTEVLGRWGRESR